MKNEDTASSKPTQPDVPNKELSDVAKRALAEAEARRNASENSDEKPREYNGPKGEEPTRFGDWERKGITYDF